MKDLRDKKVVVIGAGTSGIGAALLAKAGGADVFLTEFEPAESFAEAVSILDEHSIPYEFGGHHEVKSIHLPEFVVLSPGIPLTAPIVAWFMEKDCIPISEIEFASIFFPGIIIAVTGTNGKSTITAWIEYVLRSCGKDAYATGNIGYSFSQMVLEHPNATHAVVEISSYQLESIRDFHPKVSIWTNLTPDHILRHGSMDCYAAAKARVWMNQHGSDFAILPVDDAVINTLAESCEAGLLHFSESRTDKSAAYVLDGKIYSSVTGPAREILDTSDLSIPGKHNVLNALVTVLSVQALGLACEDFAKHFCDFQGLPHRMEKVMDDGRLWYNDSKGTNVDSVIVALEAVNAPVYLIAGGQDKGAPFTPLEDLIREKVEKILLIGEASEKIRNELGAIVTTVFCERMDEAVQYANENAPDGTTILLSPGCASFDQYSNFEQRGDHFRSLVNNISGR